MKDAVPVGRIIINKKGEFVKEVTWKDMLAGGMDAAFGYVTGSLKDVTFEIYAAEDIKAADGESSDYYKKDELVATITTDALGYARLTRSSFRQILCEGKRDGGWICSGWGNQRG